MKKYSIKVQQPGEVSKKNEQLAWRIASMASQDWELTNAISEMVGNTIKNGMNLLGIQVPDRM